MKLRKYIHAAFYILLLTGAIAHADNGLPQNYAITDVSQASGGETFYPVQLLQDGSLFGTVTYESGGNIIYDYWALWAPNSNNTMTGSLHPIVGLPANAYSFLMNNNHEIAYITEASGGTGLAYYIWHPNAGTPYSGISTLVCNIPNGVQPNGDVYHGIQANCFCDDDTLIGNSGIQFNYNYYVSLTPTLLTPCGTPAFVDPNRIAEISPSGALQMLPGLTLYDDMGITAPMAVNHAGHWAGVGNTGGSWDSSCNKYTGSVRHVVLNGQDIGAPPTAALDLTLGEMGIDDNDRCAGFCTISGAGRGWVYDNGTYHVLTNWSLPSFPTAGIITTGISTSTVIGFATFIYNQGNGGKTRENGVVSGADYVWRDINSLITTGCSLAIGSAERVNNAGQILALGEETEPGTYEVESTLLKKSYLLSPINGARVTDLGTFGGNTSAAFGINKQGQVVGTAQQSDGTNAAFLWTPTSPNGNTGSMSALPAAAGTTDSTAYAINALGETAGTCVDAAGKVHAVCTQNGGAQDIGTLGGVNGYALGINDSGGVVGWTQDARNVTRPFLYDPLTAQIVDETVYMGAGSHPVNYGIAYCTDNLGSIGGEVSPSVQIGTTWMPDSLHGVFGGTNLGLLAGGTYSRIYASSNDIAVGEADTADGDTHAITWGGCANSITDIGALPCDFFTYSAAFGVNSMGLVVGTSYTDSGFHAFVKGAGNMVDLNSLLPVDSGWTLESANAINDGYQIVGTGLYQGQEHAFLLTLTATRTP